MRLITSTRTRRALSRQGRRADAHVKGTILGMSRIRFGLALLLVAVGFAGAEQTSAYLREAPRVVALAVVFAGVVMLVRLAVPDGVSAGPYLLIALGIVALLSQNVAIAWEQVAASAPFALVAGGVAIAITSLVGARSRSRGAGPLERGLPRGGADGA